MQFGDLALGESDDLNFLEGKPLEEGGDVGLVTAQAVERLGDDDLEPSRRSRLQQGLQPGPKHRRAGPRPIGETGGDHPALALGALATQALLILDRGLPLQLRREA